jgi:hypothetical protein
VRIDPARDNQLSGGVDELIGLDRQISTYQSNRRAADEDIGMIIVDRGDNAAILDQNTHYSAPGMFDRSLF